MLTSALVDKIIGADVSGTREGGIVKDPFYTEAMIITLLNEGQLSIAGGGDRNHGLPLLAPLPELASSATLTLAVDAESVAMPATYHRGTFFVIDANGYKLDAFDSRIEFISRYPKLETGSTKSYCVQGNVFNYAPAKAQDVTIKFFRLPIDMTDGASSEPDGIPTSLQDRLLVSYVCKDIFEQIEDGIEGQKVNTGYWYNRHQAALSDLERMIGPEDREPQNVTDTSNYIYNI